MWNSRRRRLADAQAENTKLREREGELKRAIEICKEHEDRLREERDAAQGYEPWDGEKNAIHLFHRERNENGRLRKRVEELEGVLENVQDMNRSPDGPWPEITFREVNETLSSGQSEVPVSISESENQACDKTTVCVLDRGHKGACQRPGGVKVETTADRELSVSKKQPQALYTASDVSAILSVSGASSTDVLALAERVERLSMGRRKIKPVPLQPAITEERLQELIEIGAVALAGLCGQWKDVWAPHMYAGTVLRAAFGQQEERDA